MIKSRMKSSLIIFLLYNEFYKEFERLVCTELYKMNELGEISDMDWNTTGNSNCRKLYELPYPKKLLLKTILIGCQDRKECIRYSNFICEFIKRKLQFMNWLPSKT